MSRGAMLLRDEESAVSGTGPFFEQVWNPKNLTHLGLALLARERRVRQSQPLQGRHNVARRVPGSPARAAFLFVSLAATPTRSASVARTRAGRH